jgi:hypothetical protein
MTNIAKIFTAAVTLVVGTGAISGMALANTNPFYPDRLKNPNVSLPSPKVGSGVPPLIGSAIGSTSQASPSRHLEWGAVSPPLIGSAIKAMGSPRPTRLGA